MDNIKFSAFQNMCRTCMSTLDLIFIRDNNIIDVLEFLSSSKYSKCDELPQKLCVKCLQKMNEIQSLGFRCKQTHLSLTKYLMDFKNNSSSPLNETIEDYVNKTQELIDKIDKDNLELVTENLANEQLIFKQIMTKEEIIKSEENINDIPENIIKSEVIYIKQEIKDDPNISDEYLVNDQIVTEEIKNKEPSISDTSKLNINSIEIIAVPFNQDEETQSTKLNEPNLPFKCDACNKMCRTKSNLKEHMKIHSNIRPFECNVCGKKFNHSSNLNKHKRIHSGERPYQCEVCNKTFSQKGNLITHKEIHKTNYRFRCDVCMKGFEQLANLIRHKRMHSGERPYQCHTCCKTFVQKSSLVGHMAIHTNERRFQCEICKKCFRYSSNLNEHRRIHNGERPYQCNVCNKTFTSISSLRQHKARHNDVRLLAECDICNKSFITSNYLRKHKSLVHSIIK